MLQSFLFLLGVAGIAIGVLATPLLIRFAWRAYRVPPLRTFRVWYEILGLGVLATWINSYPVVQHHSPAVAARSASRERATESRPVSQSPVDRQVVEHQMSPPEMNAALAPLPPLADQLAADQLVTDTATGRFDEPPRLPRFTLPPIASLSSLTPLPPTGSSSGSASSVSAPGEIRLVPPPLYLYPAASEQSAAARTQPLAR